MSFFRPSARGSRVRLPRVQPEDDGEPADEYDPANLASDLYQDELDETFAGDLRDQLAAVERAEASVGRGHIRHLDRERTADCGRAPRGTSHG